MEKYNVRYSIAVQLLMSGTIRPGGGRYVDYFKDGNFKCDHLDKAIHLIELVDRLFSKYRFYRDRNLLIAIQTLIEKNLWDVEVMEKKLKDHSNLLEQQSSSKTWMYHLDRIYNTRNRERRRIF